MHNYLLDRIMGILLSLSYWKNLRTLWPVFTLTSPNFIKYPKKMTNPEPTNSEPKWDYTSSRQNFITGAMVVGGNLLVVILYILYRTVPSVHQIISGKPL